MNAKTVMSTCVLLMFVGLSVFAKGWEAQTVSLGNVVHTISLERLANAVPVLVVKDEFSPLGDISKITLSATMNESWDIKNMVLSCVGSGDFSPSGEIEFAFPSGARLTMLGKAVTRNQTNGLREGSVTFLLGLDELKTLSGDVRDGSVVTMALYSKRGLPLSFQIPETFFLRLFP